MSTDSDLLYIFGTGASGKGTLMRLLDGHQNLCVMPIHDKFISAYKSKDESSYIDPIDNNIFNIHKFKQLLSNSNYHRLQTIHHGRPIKLAESSDSLETSSLGNFDFYDFEQEWINRANQTDGDPHTLLYLIFQSFFDHWDEYPVDTSECNYYVGMDKDNPVTIKYLLKNFEDAKIIFLMRDPRGIVGALGNRIHSDRDARQRIANGDIFDIISTYNEVQRIASEYPDQFTIIDFEDLILNTQRVMKGIAKFINVPYNKKLSRLTYCGIDLQKQNEEHLGTIIDDWGSLLHDTEKMASSLQMGEYNMDNISLSSVYILTQSLLSYYPKVFVRRIINSLNRT